MATPKQEIFGHPRGLALLFFTEMWERFSYYGMRAIFTLYMTVALLINKEQASQIYGSYTGLVYLTPLLGGYVADRYWGNRKSIIWGGVMMAIGQFLLFLSASMYETKGLANILMWCGLLGLIFGNGFFKPNISSMVGQLYAEGDKRKDAAFTIFYMGINLGAFIAPLVCGFLGERYAPDGTPLPQFFKWGFLAACIGMVIGTVLFALDKNKYVVTPDGKPIGDRPNKAVGAGSTQAAGFSMGQKVAGVVAFALIALGFKFGLAFDWIGALIYSACIVMPALIILDTSLSRIERDRIIVIYVACFFVIFFWAAFEQAGASLTFFAKEQTNRNLNWEIPNWAIHAGSLALGAVLLWAGRSVFHNFKGVDGLSTFLYVVIVGALAYLGYANYQVASGAESGLKIGEIPASYFQSVNAVAVVLLAPVIAAFWLWLQKFNSEPNSLVKQSMGLVILALGYVVIAMGVKGVGLNDKSSMWLLIGLYVIHTVGELCLSPIGLSLVSKLAPMRLVSLLFGVWFLANAVANKAAGQLSSLYPPSGEEYANALKAGISNDTYRGILEKSITASPEQLELLKSNKIPAELPVFFGNPVNDLYEFFLIFVLLSGVAGLVLFLLSFPLKKMMHGAD
jgi:POT family proton-dependent oligopeptide transporter